MDSQPEQRDRHKPGPQHGNAKSLLGLKLVQARFGMHAALFTPVGANDEWSKCSDDGEADGDGDEAQPELAGREAEGLVDDWVGDEVAK